MVTSSQAPQRANELSLRELRELYELGGVEPALNDALRYCRDHLEPRWVFAGALESIAKLRAGDGSRTGRHSRPATRDREEARHFARWKAVHGLRITGLSLEKALEEAQPLLVDVGACASSSAIRRSYERVEKARREE